MSWGRGWVLTHSPYRGDSRSGFGADGCPHVCGSGRAAVKESLGLRGLERREVSGPRSWRPEVQNGRACRVGSRGLWKEPFQALSSAWTRPSSCSHGVLLTAASQFPLPMRHRARWLGAHLMASFRCSHLCEGPVSKRNHVLRSGA